MKMIKKRIIFSLFYVCTCHGTSLLRSRHYNGASDGAKIFLFARAPKETQGNYLVKY